MSSSICAAPKRPDPAVIADQNDAFRKFACLAESLAEAIPGRLVVTESICEAGDGFMTDVMVLLIPGR